MYVLTLRYVVKIIGCLDSYLFLYTVPTFGHGTPQGRGLLQYCSLDTSHGRSQLHMVEVYPSWSLPVVGTIPAGTTSLLLCYYGHPNSLPSLLPGKLRPGCRRAPVILVPVSSQAPLGKPDREVVLEACMNLICDFPAIWDISHMRLWVGGPLACQPLPVGCSAVLPLWKALYPSDIQIIPLATYAVTQPHA